MYCFNLNTYDVGAVLQESSVPNSLNVTAMHVNQKLQLAI